MSSSSANHTNNDEPGLREQYARSLREELWEIEKREVLQMLDLQRDGIALQLPGPLGTIDLASEMPRATVANLGVTPSVPLDSKKFAMTGLPELPVRTASVDTLVLLHTFEGLPKPAALIDEVARILVADGELVVAGFNPFSLFGLLSRARGQDRGRYRHSAGRLKQALELSDLQLEREVSNYFRPPIVSPRWRGRTELLDRLGLRLIPKRGALYVLRARKRTYRVTPVGIDFKAVEQLGLRTLPTTAREGVSRAINGN